MKNSQKHLDRINKIRTGLVTAGLQPELVKGIIEKFDALEPSVAKELAARTRFSVGTVEKLRNRGTASNPNPEGRRQMCRAIYFLEDLNCVQRTEALSRRSNDVFSALWKKNFAILAEQVKAAAQRLAAIPEDPAADEPEVPFQPPPDPPINRMVTMPTPSKYVMPPEMRSLLEAMVGSKHDAIQYRQDVSAFLQRGGSFSRSEVMPTPKKLSVEPQVSEVFGKMFEGWHVDRTSSETTQHLASTLWGYAIAGIQQHYIRELGIRVGVLATVQEATKNAYTEFSLVFKSIGTEIQGKLSLAKSLFKMLESAPFPLSVAGKVGSAAVGQLRVDTELTVTRKFQGPTPAGTTNAKTNASTLGNLKSKLKAIKDWKEELTHLGVQAKKLTNEMSLDSMIDEVRRTSLELLQKVFDSALNETFGDTSQNKMIKAIRVHDEILNQWHAQNYKDSNPGLQRHLITRGINRLEAEAKREIDDLLGATMMVRLEVMERYIELQLIAEYICVMFPKKSDETFEGGVPEAIIKRLAGEPFKLIERKKKGVKSEKIFERSHLPWVEANSKLPVTLTHSNHVGALVYFCRWYRRNINPFDLAIGQTPEEFDRVIRLYIKLLGAEIKANQLPRSLLGYAKADWSTISSSQGLGLVKVRPVVGQSTVR